MRRRPLQAAAAFGRCIIPMLLGAQAGELLASPTRHARAQVAATALTAEPLDDQLQQTHMSSCYTCSSQVECPTPADTKVSR